jgi:hypothetical protein
MDWGLEPYWWSGSQQAGPALLRSFPHLEAFTLVIRIPRWAWKDREKGELMFNAKRYVEAQIESEQSLHSDWRRPTIHFQYRKCIDWSIHSVADSLLPENRADTRLLYDWA